MSADHRPIAVDSCYPLRLLEADFSAIRARMEAHNAAPRSRGGDGGGLAVVRPDWHTDKRCEGRGQGR